MSIVKANVPVPSGGRLLLYVILRVVSATDLCVFSTETESAKRSQLLVVAEVLPANHADNKADVIKGIEADLTQAGVANTYGYRQYLVDSDRK